MDTKVDRIDEIRNNFFETIKKEEEEKVKKIEEKQSHCWHTFVSCSRASADGKYQRFSCKKCGYSCTKNISGCNIS